MWLVKAGTVLSIFKESEKNADVKDYTTKADRFYENHEVWDWVAARNRRPDIPEEYRNLILKMGLAYIRSGAWTACVAQEMLVYVK